MIAVVLALGLSGPDGGAWAASCPEVGFTVVEAKASADTRPVKLGSETIHVRRDALTQTADIIEVRLEEDDTAKLLLKFKPDAAAKLEAATTNHAGLRLAFVADDEALISVVWQGRYGFDPSGAQVSMARVSRARRLMRALSACPGSSAWIKPAGR